VVTPAGNSDTHTTISDPVGMPRTMVRVADDSAAALASGAAVDAVLAALTGTAERDIVVTDGPMIEVTAGGEPAIGRVVAATGGAIELELRLTSARWAAIDTLEVFANATPDIIRGDGVTALTPLKCWTSRSIPALAPTDPCVTAALATEAQSFPIVTVAPGFQRFETTVTVTLDAADIVNRTGATGQDAWLVFRVRGDTGIFPLVTQNLDVDDAMLAVLLAGDPAELAAAFAGTGVPAAAFTAPVFVDFDGGGYRAPFAPN
jgi:hypothetical protein